MASVELFTEYNTHDLGCVLCGELLQDVGAVKFDGARANIEGLSGFPLDRRAHQSR
jgi:hypothetical protein